MEAKKLKNVFAVGIIGILAVILISGCVGNEKSSTSEINETKDYKSIAKNNIEAEYKWKIVELRADTIKATSKNEQLIENEAEEILKNFTKENILENADEYGLGKEEISYIENLSDEEFEDFKNKEIRPYAVEGAKSKIEAAIKETVKEYNFTILELKPLNEIRDIDVYLDSYSIAEEMKENVRKKVKDGKYIAIIEMDVATKFNVVEICDEKGNIIKNASNTKH